MRGLPSIDKGKREHFTSRPLDSKYWLVFEFRPKALMHLIRGFLPLTIANIAKIMKCSRMEMIFLRGLPDSQVLTDDVLGPIKRTTTLTIVLISSVWLSAIIRVRATSVASAIRLRPSL